MSGKMHQLLAAESTVNNARDQILTNTREKFEKSASYFNGEISRLKMIKESAENAALEAQGTTERQVTTNVLLTLEYMLNAWARAEDLQIQKNVGNSIGKSNIVFRGQVVAEGVPIDEIMGLENRVSSLRSIVLKAPTLDASIEWSPDTNRGPGFWRSAKPETRVKTQKVVDPVVLYEATKEHPAQVKEFPRDETVGHIEKTLLSGAITSLQKANLIAVMDDLLISLKEARVNCNDTVVPDVSIGAAISELILQPLRS